MALVDKIENVMKENLGDMDGVKKTYKRLLIGPDQKPEFYMRYFIVEPGGNTPNHVHNWEHQNIFMKGKGILVTEDGEKEVKSNMFGYVPAGERHQFKNPFDEPFEFICLIPSPEKGDK